MKTGGFSQCFLSFFFLSPQCCPALAPCRPAPMCRSEPPWWTKPRTGCHLLPHPFPSTCSLSPRNPNPRTDEVAARTPPHRRRLRPPRDKPKPPRAPPCRPLPPPPSHACWEARDRANRALLPKSGRRSPRSSSPNSGRHRPPPTTPSTPTRLG